VVLPGHLDLLDHSVVKDGLLLLQDLLGRSHLRLGALDLDVHLVLDRLLRARDVDLGAGRLAQLLQNSTAGTDQGRHLFLLDSHGGGKRRVLEVLQERQQLVTSLVSTPLGPADDDLVGRLLTAALPSIAGRVGEGLVVLGVLGVVAGEEDEDLVACLQLVDLVPLGTNNFPVELGVNLEHVRRLILQLAGETIDVCLCRFRLGLGARQLHLAIVHLDLDVELLPELPNVAPALADQVVGELLGKFELQDEAALLLVLLLLLDELEALGGKPVHDRARAADVDRFAGVGHASADGVGGVVLLILDELLELGMVPKTLVNSPILLPRIGGQ
jgi:hypothetical protein